MKSKMVGKAAKNVSPSSIEDIDVLLDVLSNETRRRILGLISHEPMYFNQLASQIGIGQQAILRHVKILEDSGLIKSYSYSSTTRYAQDLNNLKTNSSLPRAG